MKALSIQQPWAWLIANGPKDIENRDWNTSYRGLVLIHAGKQVDSSFFDGNSLFLAYAEQTLGWDVAAVIPQSLTEYERGGIVGYATLKDVVTKSESRWFRGKYGFVLSERTPVPFIPLRGQLGLFDVYAEVEAQINTTRQ
jgi:ASCH domain